MLKFLLSCAFVACLLGVPAVSMLVNHEEVLVEENRKIAPFPRISEKIRVRAVREWFKGIELWFSDRLVFRQELMGIARKVRGENFDSSIMGKVMRGKDGWLFLSNYQEVLYFLNGKIKLTPQEIQKRTEFYKAVADHCREQGMEFVMLVGPNKASVYPEFLPPVVFPVEPRQIDLLVDAFRRAGLTVYDPTEDLKSYKDKGALYWRTDTHWNLLGAYVAVEGLRKRQGWPSLPGFHWESGDEYEGDQIKLGGYGSYLLTPGDNPRVIWDEERCKATIDQVEKGTDPGRLATHIVWDEKVCKPAINGSLLVIGDSFSLSPQHFLERLFSESFYIHYYDIFKKDRSLEQNLAALDVRIASMKRKPGTLLWIQVERNINNGMTHGHGKVNGGRLSSPGK